MSKIAIILHAEPGTHDSMGRALHSLLYTKELNEHGHNVLLIFDGGATKWIDELKKPDHKLPSLYNEIVGSDVILGVCDYCIGAFGGDREEVKKGEIPVLGDYNGHPSLAKLIDEGFQVITL